MSSNAPNIKLIQLNSFDNIKPIENKSKNWVLNGRNNEGYTFLIDRYNGSTTHATILNNYFNLFYGNGIYAKNASTNTKDWLKFNQILSKKELRKLIFDFILYNECSFQVGKAKNKKDVSYIYHLPNEKTAPTIENEDLEIEGYWYCQDWKNPNKYTPEYFPAFGSSIESIEVYKLKPYKAGQNYFSVPDYYPSLGYCIMEEEIMKYYVSHIKNGLSFGYIINIPNGKQLTEEQQDEFERKIKQKLTGSTNAGTFVLSFNDGTEAEITVVPLQVNDAHKQWEFLVEHATQKILTGHAVVSPMLFGIKDNTGFGNNADELDTAETQLYKRVIQPKQRLFLEALDEILNFYNINLDLYFRPLTETTQSTDVTMNSHVCCSDEKKKTDLDLFIEMGESPDVEGYELESVEEVDYEKEDAIELATQTGTAKPNLKSKWDTEYRIVRYRYAGNPNPEREFCKRMMKANKIYRREDIEAMGEKNVNPGFGMHPTPNKPYSIWKHKGGGLLSAKFVGGTCKHYWEKLTYKKKDIKIDVKSPIAIDEAKKEKASGIAGRTPHSM